MTDPDPIEVLPGAEVACPYCAAVMEAGAEGCPHIVSAPDLEDCPSGAVRYEVRMPAPSGELLCEFAFALR